ncbi:PREDICTED: E3 ubiquitin/ISG15 ligase TRIM25 [Nipponia nippon]|uniref:E3 ubiquitin/ISG15 ligase TRIM25 n=1 Tax=Nipponia nippon TaxID=128390 RepID=UPI000510E16E|nr:PREDICTED: E3 ubiquitin/ISG15 ligase TRIM25 [Nipponia nippon]
MRTGIPEGAGAALNKPFLLAFCPWRFGGSCKPLCCQSRGPLATLLYAIWHYRGLQAPALQTCLTCTASFCAEHLRPHQDSPAFRDHQLCPPLRDLQQRKCPQHNKLFEFFCSQHGSCICSLCLLEHKLCHTSPLQLAKANAEVSGRGGRLCPGLQHPPRGTPELPFAPPGPGGSLGAGVVGCGVPGGGWTKTWTVNLVPGLGKPLPALRRALEHVFSVVPCIFLLAPRLLRGSGKSALKKKLVELHNRSERTARAMTTLKTSQSQTIETATRKKDLIRNEFSELKALIEERENQTLKLIAEEEKRVCNKFDYIYGVLGSKKNEIQSLRDQIEMALTEGDDILFLKRAAALQQVSTKDPFIPSIEMDQNLIHSTYQSAINLKDIVKLSVTQCREKRPEAKPIPAKTKPPPAAFPNRPAVGKKPPGPPPTTGIVNTAPAVSSKELIASFLKKPREELLQYAANITLDYNTAHNKVILSERYTRMSVSDTLMNYNYHPQRFTDCSQVLGFQCFKRGIHYWEVQLQQNNFCGIGICYGSMDRQGPESRLGRNSSSWCIEWFNSKISSWHNDVEKCLPNVKATKIGVLLHCEGGFVIFMAVEEKHNLIYKFKTQFTEALYPAFWLFSSGTVLSLCQLKQ